VSRSRSPRKHKSVGKNKSGANGGHGRLLNLTLDLKLHVIASMKSEVQYKVGDYSIRYDRIRSDTMYMCYDAMSTCYDVHHHLVNSSNLYFMFFKVAPTPARAVWPRGKRRAPARTRKSTKRDKKF
jgi:hypothetical protein